MRHKSLLLPCILLVTTLAVAQTTLDIQNKIRQEENEHSQIMRTMHFLTDVYGPRLTGSPNHKAAAEWAAKQMTSWGFQNAHLEPWDFGHPGWVNERASGYITSPMLAQLTFRVLAWTNGTKGTVTAQTVEIDPPEKPKQPDIDAFLASVKDRVKGKMVMVGKPGVVPVTIDVRPRRLDDKELAQRFDPNNPNAGQFGPPRNAQPQTPPDPAVLTPAKINEQIDAFLVANGALMRINDARMEHGLIRAFNNRTYDGAKTVPTVVLRNEDYGRIARIMADGTPVTLEFNITNKWFPEGNAPKRDVRVVAIGHGHLFCGKDLSPAKEQMLLNTCNWLLGRNDRLPSTGERWSYPRVQLDPLQSAIWHWGVPIGLPVLFIYLGLVVVMVRYLR